MTKKKFNLDGFDGFQYYRTILSSYVYSVIFGKKKHWCIRMAGTKSGPKEQIYGAFYWRSYMPRGLNTKHYWIWRAQAKRNGQTSLWKNLTSSMPFRLFSVIKVVTKKTNIYGGLFNRTTWPSLLLRKQQILLV